MIAVTLAVELLLMTCIGIFAAKIKIVKGDFAAQLTNLQMKIVLPCLIIVSITAKPFSLELARQCVFAIAAGAGAVLLSLLIGQIFYLILGKGSTGRIVRFGLTFTHFSFFGVPIIDALFGETGNLYYVMFLVPVRILFYALNQALMKPGEKRKGMKDILRNVLNPCMIAVFVGLIIWLTGVQIPEPVFYCLNSLYKICSPVGLLLCGMVIGKYEFKKLLNIRYFFLPLLRTIMMPLIFLGITRLLKRIGFDSMLCDMLVIYSALPCPTMIALFAMQYETDEEVHFEAAGSVFFATLFATVTIPGWYYVMTLLG